MTKDGLNREIKALQVAINMGALISQHRTSLERLLTRHEALLARMESGVEVRIGVSVDEDGCHEVWVTCDGDDLVAAEGERISIVTAYVPRPEPVVVDEVEGSVSDD